MNGMFNSTQSIEEEPGFAKEHCSFPFTFSSSCCVLNDLMFALGLGLCLEHLELNI